MKKYKLGEVLFEWVFENELGSAFRTDDKSLPLMTFYEHQLIKLGATPIDEPEDKVDLNMIREIYKDLPDEEEFEEVEEFGMEGWDDEAITEASTVYHINKRLNKVIYNQQKLIKAVKQLQEER